MGSIRGERSWDFKEGVLRSPQYKHLWHPEENIAECKRRGGETVDQVTRTLKEELFIPRNAEVVNIRVNGFGMNPGQRDVVEIEWGCDLYSVRRDAWVPRMDAEAGRYVLADVGTQLDKMWGRLTFDMAYLQAMCDRWKRKLPHYYETCSCGFYAYLNGFNEYNHATRVTGVIEGYGETLIGSRGFRAQKARILAIAPGISAKMGDDVPVVVSLGAAIQRLSLYGEKGEKKPPSVKKLRKAYPNVAVFEDLETLRAEFPATNVDEVMEK
jgi:hypothetical protein